MRDQIRLDKQAGPVGLMETSGNPKYSLELKRLAVENYLSGKGSVDSICEEFKIRSNMQVRNLLKEYGYTCSMSGKDNC